MADDEDKEQTSLNQEALDEVMGALSKPAATASGPADTETPKPHSGDELRPVLLSVPEKRRPDPMPVCGACPKSVWWATAKTLECYCQLMHARTWTSEDPDPIMFCDGILTEEE